MAKHTCKNCRNYKEIPKGLPYCEDCCKELLKDIKKAEKEYEEKGYSKPNLPQM